MNKKGFTLIETLLSVVLISAILYGLSYIPLEVIQLKNLVNTSYDRDVSILELKQTIDSHIMDGGIIKNENNIKIGNKIYNLNAYDESKYFFKIRGVKDNVIYYANGNFSFFYLEENPNLELRYYNDFTSFKVVQ